MYRKNMIVAALAVVLALSIGTSDAWGEDTFKANRAKRKVVQPVVPELLFDPAFVEKPQIYQCPKTELKYKITEGSWIGEERKFLFNHVEVQDAYSGKKWLICVYGVGSGAGAYQLRRMVSANHTKCEPYPTIHSNKFLCAVMKPK